MTAGQISELIAYTVGATLVILAMIAIWRCPSGPRPT